MSIVWKDSVTKSSVLKDQNDVDSSEAFLGDVRVAIIRLSVYDKMYWWVGFDLPGLHSIDVFEDRFYYPQNSLADVKKIIAAKVTKYIEEFHSALTNSRGAFVTILSITVLLTGGADEIIINTGLDSTTPLMDESLGQKNNTTSFHTKAQQNFGVEWSNAMFPNVPVTVVSVR